jgi:hypothetical protein
MSYRTSTALLVSLEQAVRIVRIDSAPGEKTFGSVTVNQLLMLLVAAVAAVLIIVRLYVNCGWGDRLLQPGNATSAYGFEQNGEDNLSYISWIQQTRLGHFRLSNLYTTEPHDPLIANVTFYAIGRASAVFGWAPAFVFNLCGFIGALLAVAFVFRYAVRIGFSTGSAFWATFVVAFGSGFSWVSYLVDYIYGAHVLGFGADMTYLDLIPSTIFHMYPDHAIALALLSFLMLAVVKLEEALLARGSCRWRIVLVFVGALILSMSRPYEPVAFFVVYSLYTVLPIVLRKDRAAFWARVTVWSVLVGPIVVFAAYNLWASSQPVWSNLAERSLNLPKNGVRRTYWILGFGWVWVLAAVGVVETFRRKLARFELAAIWSMFVFTLLIVLNSGRSKLASGAFLSLALMSGPVLDSLWCQLFQGTGKWQRTALRIGVIVALTGILSPVFVHLTNRLTVPTIDPEIVFAGERVKQDTTTDMPTVLTDTESGDLLPGLWGMRVYVGHWMLSPNYESKVKELEAAGLLPTTQSERSLPSETAENFDRLLNKINPEYVMIRTSSPLAQQLKRSTVEIIYQGSRWIVFARHHSTNSVAAPRAQSHA